jgi:hypothetical protein|tara:strand:- start:2066 stop:2362 length:297 start_codon:yes stop_codon:yes gene_type:complete
MDTDEILMAGMASREERSISSDFDIDFDIDVDFDDFQKSDRIKIIAPTKKPIINNVKKGLDELDRDSYSIPNSRDTFKRMDRRKDRKLPSFNEMITSL